MMDVDNFDHLAAGVSVTADGMVSKADFEAAILSAQEALRAKNAASQTMLQEASSAMRNAVTALSLSEQEVANLRVTVKELTEREVPGQEGARLKSERAALRAAQRRIDELSSSFRNLQSEIAHAQYEREKAAGERVRMPVASKFPVRIDPLLASRAVVVAQLVMLGYDYDDAEDAIDECGGVNDAGPALALLEARGVQKIVWDLGGVDPATGAAIAPRLVVDEGTTRKLEMESEAWRMECERVEDELDNALEMLSLANAKLAEVAAAGREVEDSPPKGREGAAEAKFSGAGAIEDEDSGTEDEEELDAATYDDATRGRIDSVTAYLSRKKWRKAVFTEEQIYTARRRAVTLLATTATNAPGALGRFGEEHDVDMAKRAIDALGRLARGPKAYLVLVNGGPRAAIDALKLYDKKEAVAVACVGVLDALLRNDSTRARFKRQVRFRNVANALSVAAGRADAFKVTVATASALWAYANLGETPAQVAVVASGFIPVLLGAMTDALEGEGAELGTFTADDARSLVGCALSIAKGNETIQDVLVRDGARAKVRALLLKYPTVSFDGEFTPLRDWIRGDRTNSRSAEPKTPREKGAAGAGRKRTPIGDESESDDEAATKERAAAREREEAKTPERDHAERVLAASAGEEETPPPKAKRALAASAGEDAAADLAAKAKTETETAAKKEPGEDASKENSSELAGELAADMTKKVETWKAAPSKKTVKEAIKACVKVLRDERAPLASSCAPALDALAEIMTTEPKEVSARGGVGAVTVAMERDGTDKAFVAGSLALVSMLAFNAKTAKLIKADAEVTTGRTLRVVLLAMQTHKNSKTIIQWGSMTLWALVKNSAAAKRHALGLDLPDRGNDDGKDKGDAGELLVEALKKWGEEHEAVAKGLVGACLALATKSQAWQDKLASLDAPALIMKVLSKHPQVSFKGEFDTLRAWLRAADAPAAAAAAKLSSSEIDLAKNDPSGRRAMQHGL